MARFFSAFAPNHKKKSMKSKLLCIALLLAVSVTRAQKFAQNVSFGPIVGLGHAWMTGMEGDKEFKFAPSAGVTFIYSAGPNWGFGIDLKYSREGSKVKSSSFGLEGTTNASYLRVPVKAIYFFGELGQKTRPKVMLGPSMGILLGGKHKIETSEGSLVAEGEVKDIMHRFDMGVQVGAGLNQRLSRNTWLNTDISYYHGLRDLQKNGNDNWKNRNIAISVGVAFGIGTIREDK
jgi:outer membrane protein W